MDVRPGIEFSLTGVGVYDVRAPLRAIANTDAPVRVRRKEPILTQITHKGEVHELCIWPSRKRGIGTRGVIFEADMVSPCGRTEVVAVRAFNSLFNEKSSRLLQQAVSTWQLVDHPRVLPFYGISAQFGLQQVALVSALAPNGNMKDFIVRNPAKDRLRLLAQVAEGLRYLHVTMGIVHGDLKLANVLISADESAVLADFGLSTLFEQTKMPSATSVRIRNMAPFAAPELFNDRMMRRAMHDVSALETPSRTTRSDVFAFGGLIYEAYSCSEPWLATKTALEGGIPTRDAGTYLAVPLSDRLWDLCLRCWDRDPFKRPDSSEILNFLTVANTPPKQEMLDQTVQ